MPLIKILFDQKRYDITDIKHTEKFCNEIKDIFSKEPPALLHRDLWSENYKVDNYGRPAIYDPSVYYGHWEFDIGMTKLFGGYSNELYDRYNEVYPLDKNWKNRFRNPVQVS